MPHDFISKITPPTTLETPALWFVFCQNKLLLVKDEKSDPILQAFDLNKFGFKILFQNYLGQWRHQDCFCVEIELPEKLPDNVELQALREAAKRLNLELFNLAGRAIQILQWDRNHQFCGRCGQPLKPSTTERAKICEACHLPHYPRISPSIIVLIKRGKEVLLARSPHFPPGIYSTLAGFVEPGETAEHAVEREVMEEVGIKIKNLQYRFSQPWPFPDSLMLGFTAEHEAGEIEIDGVEIEDAGWFTLENLPNLSSPISIARQLIDLFIHKEF